MSEGKFHREEDEFAETLHRLARQGVPSARTEEALLDIVKSSLRIAREAYGRIQRNRPTARD